MMRSHMAETLKAAVTFIEQGRILATCNCGLTVNATAAYSQTLELHRSEPLVHVDTVYRTFGPMTQ